MSKFATEFSYKSRDTSTKFDSKSLTKQNFKSQCDINRIIKQYVKNGIPVPSNPAAMYADVSSINDYQSCLDQVMRAEASFMSLPAKVRSKFENNPANFVDFVQNPDNFDELCDLGLAERPEALAPQAVEPETRPDVES